MASPGRGVAPANVDAIEISILEACVRNLPDPPRRALFSITDPGHPHTAILDEDSADGLHQLDFLCGPNERLVAAIDGSQGAVGGSQLFLNAHALRDFG